MKRVIKICFILLIMFLFTNNVKASEAKCYYGSNTFKLYVQYTSGSVVTVSQVYTASTLQYTGLGNYYVKPQDLTKPDGTLYCPDKLYYEMTVAARDVRYHVSFTRSTLNNPMGEYSLISNESKVTNDPIDPNNPSSKDTICNYGKDSMIFNKDKGTISFSIYGVNSNIPMFGPNISALATYDYKCPPKLCYYCNTRESQMCNIGFEEVGLLKCNGQGIAGEEDNDGGPQIDGTPIDPGSPPSCADFQEITGPIWFWIKIIGPVLAVVFGTMDLLRAVAASDEKGTRKAVSDFGKRLALCALLFLLHIIVNMLVGFTSYVGVGSCL